MQSFVDFGTRTVLEDYFFDHPLDIFFLTFLFFVPSLKRRLILLFVPVFCCVICLFQCSAVITLVRFFIHKFFFLYSHRFVIQASVDCTNRPMPWWGVLWEYG